MANQKWSLAIAACLALVVSACSPSPQSMIVGKWDVESAPMKMTAEFHRDGTANLTMFGQTVQGTYKLTPDNELVWSLNGRSTTAKAKVTATELELTDSQNRTIKYKRQ